MSTVNEITPDMYVISLMAPPFLLTSEKLLYLLYFIEKETEIIFDESDLVNGGFTTISKISRCMNNYSESVY